MVKQSNEENAGKRQKFGVHRFESCSEWLCFTSGGR